MKKIPKLTFFQSSKCLTFCTVQCVISYFPCVMRGGSTPTVIWQSNQRDASVRGFSIFAFKSAHMSVCLFVSHLLTKRKTIQTWKSVHTVAYTIFENGFFIFSKNCSRSKNCRIAWFYLYLFDWHAIYFFPLCTLIYVSMLVYGVCVTPIEWTKIDRDLKFDTHMPPNRM